MKKYLLLIIPVFFMLTGCPDDDPVKPDPCAGKYPVKAEIEIWESKQGFEYLFKSDTIIRAYNIGVFKCPKKFDYYQWKIGDQLKEYSNQQFSMWFYEKEPDTIQEGNIPITLIVKSKPDSTCFPFDDGIDSTTKNVFVINLFNAKIFGNYYGYDTSNPKVFYTVSIGKYYSIKNKWLYYYINNIHNGCIDTAFFSNPDIGPIVYKEIYNTAIVFDARDWVGYGCLRPKGIAYLLEDRDSLIIEYTIIKEFQGKEIPMKFIGRRVK